VSALARFTIVVIGAAAFSLMGVLLGAWWAPLIGGLAAGLFIPKAGWAVLAGALAGLVSWAVPLEYAHLQYGLEATSLSLAAIMGFNGAALVPIVLTLLTGTLLGFCTAWFGSVARSFYAAPRAARQPATAPKKESGRPLDAAARRVVKEPKL
jgi:hypothetical protein